MIDVRLIVFLCGAIFALVLGGFGLGKVMFERGYVHGYEDASHGVTIRPEGGE
jgi:hypothetical protein